MNDMTILDGVEKKKAPEGLQYYPFTRKWRTVRPHLTDPDFRAVLERDFNKFTFGKWGDLFGPGQFPADFETCAWRSGRAHYWQFVNHSACHWLVNANLKLAELSEPRRRWRILTSERHSTVWDGELTLFDMNFSALRIQPEYAFEFAYQEELAPGEQLQIRFAAPCGSHRRRFLEWVEARKNERLATKD